MVATLLLMGTMVWPGCGSAIVPDFPHQIIGTDGSPITLIEVEVIVNDPDLNDDEKRDALRELGVEDEKLIDALLTL